MPNSKVDKAAQVTIIIPNWNGMNWLPNCLDALDKQSFKEFEIIVVDNASSDSSVPYLKHKHPKVQLIELDTNTGFANAVNVGIENAHSPLIALLNTDTIVEPDWLEALYNRMKSAPQNIGAISSQMLMMDDPSKLDDAGDTFSWYGEAKKIGNNQPIEVHAKEMEVFSPCAGAAIYRSDFLKKIGSFDAGFFAYLEDVDLGFRGRVMGYEYLYLPDAKVLHKGHGSNINSGLYVKLSTRNRLAIIAKNIPASLLLRHSFKLIYGQIYFFVAYAKPISSLKGYVSFCIGLPEILRQRKNILSQRKISNEEFNQMLEKNKPDPALMSLLGQRIRKILGRLNGQS